MEFVSAAQISADRAVGKLPLPPEFQPSLVGFFTFRAIAVQLKTGNTVRLGFSTGHTKAGLVGPTVDPLLEKAVAANVAYVPGFAFYPTGGGENAMRLNFSNASEEMINEGIYRLGLTLKQELVGK